MRLSYAKAMLILVMVLSGSVGTNAAQPRRPSGQQAQCAASGGTFSIGYEADTYVCVTGEGRTVQTCRFGKSDPSCSTEDGPNRGRAGQSGGGKSVFGFGLF